MCLLIKQSGLSDILTYRGVVGHSLQLLDDVYIQQLKREQVLEKVGNVRLLAVLSGAILCLDGTGRP